MVFKSLSRGFGRRDILLLIPSFLASTAFVGSLNVTERERENSGSRLLLPFEQDLEVPKYNEKSFVEYFRGKYGKKAGDLAALAMDSYRKHRSGYPYDPLLFMSQIKNESNFGNPGKLISRVGAGGSTQVMPDTAEREPFELKVYHPHYYKEARAFYTGKNGTLKQAVESMVNDLENENGTGSPKPEKEDKVYSGAELTRILDTALYAIGNAKGESGGNPGGSEVNYADLMPRLGRLVDERMIENLVQAYELYEDELGSMVYEGYAEGDTRRMRDGLMKPLRLLPEKELMDEDQRFVDGIVVPKSYGEMQRLLDKYGNVGVALAAYNAGERALPSPPAVPNIRETRNYVSSVLNDYKSFPDTLAQR